MNLKYQDLKVEILAPQNIGTLDVLFDSSNRLNYIEPFSEERCNTLSLFSQEILQDPILKKDPASVALGYWFRKSEIERLKLQFLKKVEENKETIFTPIGKVFHIAPANVDTIFVYSWAISFLCGNSNIVRISEQKNELALRIIKCIQGIMKKNEDLRNSNYFITYSHNDNITEEISQWCNHRVIWGGDETVKAIRPLHLNSYASERVFGSKFSYSIISNEWFASLSEEVLTQLSSRFFNDIFWFDQMACSSPHIIFWVGNNNTSKKSIEVFNKALEKEIKKRGWSISLPQAVKRLNFTFDKVVSSDLSVDFSHEGFTSLEIKNYKDLGREICGGGLISHLSINSLFDVVDFVKNTDQTITHSGFDKNELTKFAKLAGSKGIARIVPVGEALSFNIIWDGYDLTSDFVRKVFIHYT